MIINYNDKTAVMHLFRVHVHFGTACYMNITFQYLDFQPIQFSFIQVKLQAYTSRMTSTCGTIFDKQKTLTKKIILT